MARDERAAHQYTGRLLADSRPVACELAKDRAASERSYDARQRY